MIKGVILELNGEQNIYAILLTDGTRHTVLPAIKNEDGKYLICPTVFARGDFSVLTEYFDQVEELDPMEAEEILQITENPPDQECPDEELLKEVLEELFEFTVQQLEEV